MLKGKIAQEFRERTVESFLDFLILTTLTKERSMKADDLVDFINQKIKVSVGSGLVYSHLFRLEQDRLIHGEYDKNSKFYRITQKGKEKIKLARKHMNSVQWVIDQILER